LSTQPNELKFLYRHFILIHINLGGELNFEAAPSIGNSEQMAFPLEARKRFKLITNIDSSTPAKNLSSQFTTTLPESTGWHGNNLFPNDRYG
jgi:hypothetical protein